MAKKKPTKKKTPAKKARVKKVVTKKTRVAKKASKKKTVTKKATKKKISKTPKAQVEQLSLAGWPSDRELLWNPDRFKYLKRPKSSICPFCASANVGEGFESLNLYLGTSAQTIINKYPYHTGHIMVMPVRHVASLENLSSDEYGEIMLLLRESARILKSVYKCDGMNIGINLGKAAGAGIPDHIHWHIIPRWSGDTNFFPALAKTRVISESLHDTFEKLRPEFEKLHKNKNIPGHGKSQQVEFKL
ncbi:MAG: HIT domain-containing protein [Bdellovibrionales bacterium]